MFPKYCVLPTPMFICKYIDQGLIVRGGFHWSLLIQQGIHVPCSRLRKPNGKTLILFIYLVHLAKLENHMVYMHRLIPNDCSVIGDVPFLVWSCVWAMTSKLQVYGPQTITQCTTHSRSNTSLTYDTPLASHAMANACICSAQFAKLHNFEIALRRLEIAKLLTNF